MRPSTVKLLIVLVIAVLAGWFFLTHERRIMNEYVGYSGEARYNNFLAAELLLKQVDIEADARSSWTPSVWLPDVSDTIVSRINTSVAVASEQEILLNWVGDGGHLLVFPPDTETRASGQFMGAIGIELYEIELPGVEDADEDSAATEFDPDADYFIDLDYAMHRIKIIADEFYEVTLSDEAGVIVARRYYGNGYITVIANDRFFHNRLLARHDHARLFLDAVAGYLTPGKVWFILNESFPSLWQLLTENASFVLIALAAALVLWLWSIMPRFGPPIDSKPVARRSIVEHVSAAGHFTFSHSGSASLVERSVKALAHEADRKTPGFSRLSPDAQAQHLAVISDLPAQEILDVLLSSNHDAKRREFTHNIQILQFLRKKL